MTSVVIPTETSTGEIKRICANDFNHVDTFVFPVLNVENYPNYEEQATCDTGGSIRYFFEKDGTIFIFDGSVPSGHLYGELIGDSAATCDEEGWLAHYECSRCNKYFDESFEEVSREDIEIPALSHDYGAWSDELSPTTDAVGLLKRTCTRDGCESFESIELPVLNVENSPEYYEYEEIDVSCETGGHGIFRYTKDGEIFEYAVNVLSGHIYGDWTEYRAATCEDD